MYYEVIDWEFWNGEFYWEFLNCVVWFEMRENCCLCCCWLIVFVCVVLMWCWWKVMFSDGRWIWDWLMCWFWNCMCWFVWSWFFCRMWWFLYCWIICLVILGWGVLWWDIWVWCWIMCVWCWFFVCCGVDRFDGFCLNCLLFLGVEVCMVLCVYIWLVCCCCFLWFMFGIVGCWVVWWLW